MARKPNTNTGIAPDPLLARRIIQQLGSSGQPPEVGVQFFTVGIDPYLDVIDDEYLASFIPDGGSAFKLVVGAYGGGKTHFLYTVRNRGWARDFAVSYVSLKAGGECPFNRLDLVYKSIISGLLPPITDPDVSIDETKGVENFLRYWYAQRLERYRGQGKSAEAARVAVREDINNLAAASVHSISFRNAVIRALESIAMGEDRIYSEICQWLMGEGPPTARLKKLSITQRVDRTTAFSMIRSLGQTMRLLDYSGFLVLLDEAELVPSLSKGQREQLLSNLREFVDECGNHAFQGMMVFYAVPDRNFLDGRTQIYEALRQRLSTTFEMFNPTGVTIELDDAVGDANSFLYEVGNKILGIYNSAYAVSLDPDLSATVIIDTAEAAISQRYMDTGYRRLFVQQLVKGLSILHRANRLPTQEEMQ